MPSPMVGNAVCGSAGVFAKGATSADPIFTTDATGVAPCCKAPRYSLSGGGVLDGSGYPAEPAFPRGGLLLDGGSLFAAGGLVVAEGGVDLDGNAILVAGGLVVAEGGADLGGVGVLLGGGGAQLDGDALLAAGPIFATTGGVTANDFALTSKGPLIIPEGGADLGGAATFS